MAPVSNDLVIRQVAAATSIETTGKGRITPACLIAFGVCYPLRPGHSGPAFHQARSSGALRRD